MNETKENVFYLISLVSNDNYIFTFYNSNIKPDPSSKNVIEKIFHPDIK